MSDIGLDAGERFAKVGELDICFEAFGRPSNPPLLLIAGLGAQMIWYEDGAGAVHGELKIEIHLAPRTEQDLVAGTDDIVGSDGDAIERGEGGGHAFKQARAEDGQDLADR